MAEKTARELNWWEGGLYGVLLGVGIAFGIAGLLWAQNIWPFDFFNVRTAIPLFAVLGMLVLLVVCPLCLGVLGIVHAVRGWWPFRKKKPAKS